MSTKLVETLWFRSLASFISTMVLSILWALYVLALSNKLIVFTLLVDFFIPWVTFFSFAWWVDETSWSRRGWLTLATALGAVLGTYIGIIAF